MKRWQTPALKIAGDALTRDPTLKNIDIAKTIIANLKSQRMSIVPEPSTIEAFVGRQRRTGSLPPRRKG
jgi:hypothetical protein